MSDRRPRTVMAYLVAQHGVIKGAKCAAWIVAWSFAMAKAGDDWPAATTNRIELMDSMGLYSRSQSFRELARFRQTFTLHDPTELVLKAGLVASSPRDADAFARLGVVVA